MASANKSWIKFTPLGGANTVTGSCSLITITVGKEERSYMVDCGLFTDKEDSKFNTNIAGVMDKVRAIFATHAHVDHIGRLPYAYKLGYYGPIYATSPVKALARIVLNDSARIQEQEYYELMRKLKIRNQKFIDQINLSPLYTVHDAEQVMHQFVSVERNKKVRVDEFLEVEFFNAGHALGSSSIMLNFNNGKETYRLYFSGDIGQNNPILKMRRDSLKKDVDYVFMETTYAGRYHPKREESWNELRELVAKTIKKGGNVILPAFAVGRTQEILYLYYKDIQENDDWVARTLRKTPVYVDSYMTVLATQEFRRFPNELKEPVQRLFAEGNCDPFDFPQLTMVASAEASKELTQNSNNYVVISSAGMCNAGRVLYHLVKDLPNPRSTIIFTGYQAEGTLGRQIIEGKKMVKINGKPINIRANIASIRAFSAHVDNPGLIKWLEKIENGYTLFLGHGEPDMQKDLKSELVSRGLVSKHNIELSTLGKSYYLHKDSVDIVKLPATQIPECAEMHAKDRLKEIERIRNFLQVTPTNCLDSETIRLIQALENRLTREITRAKKAAKCQAKPNRKNTGRRKK